MKSLSGKPFFTKTRIQFIFQRIIFPFLAVYSVRAILTVIRDMNIETTKLRGSVVFVPEIPEGSKKIDDRRKWQ